MESDNTALVPFDERIVDFYGDEIVGVVVQIEHEVHIYVPIRPLCAYLGLSWTGQRERIMRDDVLADVVRGVRVTRTPGTGGGTQEVLCLPLDYLPGWLFGINAARVKPDLKERIVLYKRECYRRLWETFKHDILGVEATPPAQTDLSGAAMAYEIATAVQHLARQQMEMEQRLTGRIDKMGQWAKSVTYQLDDLQTRVGSLELHVGPAATIDDQQAAEIALAVKNVGHALTERGIKPGYSQVYAEMYRRYGISSYKNLPRDKYEEVLAWLRKWYGEVPGAEDIP